MSINAIDDAIAVPEDQYYPVIISPSLILANDTSDAEIPPAWIVDVRIVSGNAQVSLDANHNILLYPSPPLGDTYEIEYTLSDGQTIDTAVISLSLTAVDSEFDGTSFTDQIDGGAGNDWIRGLGGDDLLYGGTGTDTVAYDETSLGVSVDLAAGTASGSESGSDSLFGFESIIGGTGDDSLFGDGAVNTLNGGAGADLLDGRAGSDTMHGGSGNDTYVVDDSNDIVDEDGADGTDTILSSITFNLDTPTVLGALENLTLSGTEAINGTGNDLANTLIGNAAANILQGYSGADTLDGGAGNDTLRGGGGDDIYVVDSAGDVVDETFDVSGGVDTVHSDISFSLGWATVIGEVENLTLTGIAAINGTGNAFANILIGNGAANILNGGAGADTMHGGGGNDTYVVDDIADVVDEATAGSSGTDTVQAAVSFTLAAGIENLTLTGAAAINGVGNSFANILTGNTATNILNGGGGADNMRGGAGNDTYIVDNAADIVDEAIAGSGGTDTVQSSINFSLADSVDVNGVLEYLILTGSAVINGTGNSSNNLLVGNAANNTLTGGSGNDIFRFNTALSASNIDLLSDFNVAQDQIQLDDAVMSALGATGALGAARFVANATGTATTAAQRICYDTDNGLLFYDSNGNAAGGRIQFARVDAGLALTHSDFVVM